jgi:16S rRNA G966 N2-methylase RsmD
MTNSLTIFTKASQMLAEADTIQKAKELKSLALTAADWAQRKGMGEEAIQHCRSYALEAERKMGEMLLATERAKPPNPKPPKERRSHDVTDDVPTLASLGLTKRDSAEAQELAQLDEADFEAVRTGRKTRKETNREVRAKRDRARKTAQLKCENAEGVRKGNFVEVLDDIRNINAIITDPPYGKSSLHLWRELGRFSADRLTDDGVLVAYSGQMYLPQVLAALGESLDYFWLLAVPHKGSGNLTPLGQPVRKVINQWKPLVFFCKKGCGFQRVFRDVVPAKQPDKTSHNWAQSVSEAEWLIKQFTEPGEMVVDPFAGSGSVGIAAKNAGRKFIGAEILL